MVKVHGQDCEEGARAVEVFESIQHFTRTNGGDDLHGGKV